MLVDEQQVHATLAGRGGGRSAHVKRPTWSASALGGAQLAIWSPYSSMTMSSGPRGLSTWAHVPRRWRRPGRECRVTASCQVEDQAPNAAQSAAFGIQDDEPAAGRRWRVATPAALVVYLLPLSPMAPADDDVAG